MKRVFSGLGLVFFIVFAGCSENQAGQIGNKPIILVSIAPQKYFLEQVAGKDTFDIVVIVPEGQSPHSYEPSPSQLALMSRGAVWFTTGVEFEEVLVPKLLAIAPGIKIADTTQGIVFREFDAHEHEGDEHESDEHESGEPEGEHHDEYDHSHKGKDPHVWMGFVNVQIQSRIMSEVLSELFPEKRDSFITSQKKFAERITALKGELAAKTAGLSGMPVFVYHPAFGYLLDELGLKQVPIEIAGKEPGPQQLEAVIAAMKQVNAHVLFVQKQFPVMAAKKIAASAGAKVVELDPLAYDWENSMRSIAGVLTAAVKQYK